MKSFKSFTLAVFVAISAGHAAFAQGCDLSSEKFMRSATPEMISDCVAALDEAPPIPAVKNLVRFGDPFSVDNVLASLSEDTMNTLRSAGEQHVPTLMHMAINNPDPAVLAVLAAWGFDPNAMTEYDDGGWLGFARGTTPLHLAAKAGKADHVAMLLAIGADPTIEDPEGRTPDSLEERIHFYGRFATRYVLEAFHAPGDEETITSIIRDRPFGSRPRKSPVSCDQFLTKQFFQNATGSDIRSCFKQGAKPFGTNKNGDTALHLASAWGTSETILSVVRAVPREQLKRLLSLKNREGDTPLHYAAKYSKDPDNVSLLIALGAKVSSRNNKGLSPLHLAVTRKDLASNLTARLLASKPAGEFLNIKGIYQKGKNLILGSNEVRDNNGNTPLHRAAIYSETYLPVLVLLNHGYSPDTANNKGMTPLMYAAYREQAGKLSDKNGRRSPILKPIYERRLFKLLIQYSKAPCAVIGTKYGEQAGRSALTLARNNSALTYADASGKFRSSVSILQEKCSQ